MVDPNEYLIIGDHMPASLDGVPRGDVDHRLLHPVPSSYLDVLREFGAGEFVDTFHILPPDELVTYGSLLGGYGLELPTELASIVVCAAGSEGSRFGWRLSDDINESGERPVVWVPNGCLDLDDGPLLLVATSVTELVKTWALPRWAGPGIRQPYFVTRQPRETWELRALTPGRSPQTAHDRLAAALVIDAEARVLYQHSRIEGATLRCYLPSLCARLYVETSSPESTQAAFDSRARLVAPFVAMGDAVSTTVTLLESQGWALENLSIHGTKAL